MKPAALRVLTPLLAVSITLAAGTGLLLLGGVDIGAAARAFGAGTFGSAADFAETLVAATPLLLCGLGVALSFRAGLFNIGAEGQLLMGMLAACWVGTRQPQLALPGALAAGVLAGAACAAIAAWLRVRRGVSEVLATLLLNFVAVHLVSLAVHGWLQEAAGSLPQSDRLASACELPRMVAGTRFHLGIPLAGLFAVGCFVIVHRSRFGLRMRAAGTAPRAAAVAGFPVARDLWLTLLLSGGLAGLAGAVEICGVTRVLFEDPSPGFGYAAIAVALLGRQSAPGVVLAALFFGMLENGGGAMQRHAGVSAGFVQLLQGLALLALLALDSPRMRSVLGRGADAEGQP